MVDRQSLGDLCLAILLALPFAVLALGDPPPTANPAPVKAASASHSEGRLSLLG